MPKPRARWATSWPMRPKPMMPSVFSYSSTPLYLERSQRPSTSEACAWGTLRASAVSSAMVCSAAVITLDWGALATTMPRRVAASTSTLSTPTPARPTALRLSALSIRSAVSLVAERMRMPSNSPMRRSSSPSSQSAPSSTSNPASRSSSTPLSPIFSVHEHPRHDSVLHHAVDAGRERARRRPARRRGTCRCAAGCGPACGRARCRRCRWRAASRPRRRRRPPSSKSIVPTTSERWAWIGHERRRELRAGRPSRTGARTTPVVRATQNSCRPPPAFIQSICSASSHSVATAGVL